MQSIDIWATLQSRGHFTPVACAMTHWCMCTDDRPPQDVFVEDELIESRHMYKTLLPGSHDSYGYANEEYASQTNRTRSHMRRNSSETILGGKIGQDATSRVIRRPSRLIEKPQSMASDDPFEAARVFTEQLGERLRCLSCVRCNRMHGHELCSPRQHVHKDDELPNELLSVGERVEYFNMSVGTWVQAHVVRVNAKEGTYVLENKAKGATFSVPSVRKVKEGFEASEEYAVGEVVEYYSQSGGSWIPARVLGSYGNGKYRLDCKQYASPEHIRRPKAPPRANSWLSTEDAFAAVGMVQDFLVGEAVEYDSKTQGGWIAAKVLSKNPDGTYNLDVKPDAVPSKMRRQSTAPAALFQTIVPDYLLEPTKPRKIQQCEDEQTCGPQLFCPSRASRRFRLMCSAPTMMCPQLAPVSLTDEHANYDHYGHGCCDASDRMESSMLY